MPTAKAGHPQQNSMESILSEITMNSESSSINSITPTSQGNSTIESINNNNNNLLSSLAPPSPMTNALLVTSPYKLLPPPHESSWNPWQAELQKTELTAALYSAVQDEELYDVLLVANDGAEVPASRFVLAARSPVLKRMLYGSFREAKSSTICMMGYEQSVLQAVVHYCQTNHMPILPMDKWEDLEKHIRQLVRLYQAADFFELTDLGALVYSEIRRLTGLYPGLACVVFDEVDDTASRVGEFARLMMEVRPYVSLAAGTRKIASSPASTAGSTIKLDLDDDSEAVGGVECMKAERLQIVLKSPNIQCGELFLFQMLRQWYDHKINYLGENVDESTEYEHQATDLLEAALQCAKCLAMENIEPAALLQIVQPSPFIHPTFLFDAFAKQALRASQNRYWSLDSRPVKYQSVERILVEDCGSKQARGMYVRMVSGLKKTHATLYTKREVVSGQAMVYTLSCSVNQGQVECRIFCSPLLTPQAVPTLFQFHSSACVDPNFQPILQIVAMKPFSGKRGSSRAVVLSDGHHCMQGTLANNMAIHNSKEVLLYGVLQVLAFRLYTSGSSKIPKIHVQRVSIVNSDAGQVFGRPAFSRAYTSLNGNNSAKEVHPLAEDDASHVPESVAGDEISDVNNTTIKDDDMYTAHHHASVKDLKHVTVLYSCSYPLKKQARDTRIPRLGWQVEEAGKDPPPACTWIPAVKKSSAYTMAASTAAATVISGLTWQSLGTKSLAKGPHKSSSGAAADGSTSSPAPRTLASILKYEGDCSEESDGDDISSALSGIHASPSSASTSSGVSSPFEV